MGLAQQVMLPVMLNDHSSLIAQQAFAVNSTLSDGGRGCLLLQALPLCYPYVT